MAEWCVCSFHLKIQLTALDLAFKKQPPEDYFFPPHDILGSLALIKTGLQNDYYKSEYDFSLDLYHVFISGHDGHFIFLPDTLAAVFEFTRPKALVSVSEDGILVPKIKLYGMFICVCVKDDAESQ